MNEERTWKCLRQVEHIHDHLWNRYSTIGYCRDYQNTCWILKLLSKSFCCFVFRCAKDNIWKQRRVFILVTFGRCFLSSITATTFTGFDCILVYEKQGENCLSFAGVRVHLVFNCVLVAYYFSFLCFFFFWFCFSSSCVLCTQCAAVDDMQIWGIFIFIKIKEKLTVLSLRADIPNTGFWAFFIYVYVRLNKNIPIRIFDEG